MQCFAFDRWQSCWIASSFAVIAALGLLASCDTSVDVVRPSEEYQYSLYGVLDVAADTQFVRVEPLGDDTQLGAPLKIPAKVFLQNMNTGARVELRDSFATIRSDAMDSHSAQVHVFWTTYPVQKETRYRVQVEEEGDVVTHASTTTPRRPPSSTPGQAPIRLPCCPRGRYVNQTSVWFEDVGSLASAKVTYPLRGGITFQYADSVKSIGGYKLIPIHYGANLRDLNRRLGYGSEGCVALDRFDSAEVLVKVATAGPFWPQDWRLPTDPTVEVDSVSNVEGGRGFVGAIYSTTTTVPLDRRWSCPPGS